MAWDSNGWHEFEKFKTYRDRTVVDLFCGKCGYHKEAHMTKIEYVSARLDGRRTNALGQ